MGFRSLVPSLASPEGLLFEPLTMRGFYVVPESIAKNWCTWSFVSLNYLLWFYNKLFWRITHILAFYLHFFYMFSFFLVCISYKSRDEKHVKHGFTQNIAVREKLKWFPSSLHPTAADLLPMLMLSIQNGLRVKVQSDVQKLFKISSH